MKVFVDDILSMISYFEHKPRNKVVEIAFSDFDNKEEKGYLFAELKEDRVDAVVLSKSVISDVKTQINKGLSRSFGDAAVIEEGGYSFTDEENHHFKTNEYNKLQDIAVMAFGMMEFVKDTSSYTMRKFVHMHSNRLLDYIKIEKTWLNGDRDRLDEDGDYWLDEIDHSEITYQLGIAYNYKGAEFDNIAFLDGIDDAIAYADGFWEALSEEEKAKYNKFDLCVIEAVDDDYTVEYYSKYTIKDYFIGMIFDKDLKIEDVIILDKTNVAKLFNTLNRKHKVIRYADIYDKGHSLKHGLQLVNKFDKEIAEMKKFANDPI